MNGGILKMANETKVRDSIKNFLLKMKTMHDAIPEELTHCAKKSLRKPPTKKKQKRLKKSLSVLSERP